MFVLLNFKMPFKSYLMHFDSRLMERCLEGDILKTHELPSLVISISKNPKAYKLAWEFLKSNWQNLIKKWVVHLILFLEKLVRSIDWLDICFNVKQIRYHVILNSHTIKFYKIHCVQILDNVLSINFIIEQIHYNKNVNKKVKLTKQKTIHLFDCKI